MMKKFAVRLIIILGINLIIGHTYLFSLIQQNSSSLTEQTSALLPLVGQKCTAFLKNGDKINGTLWDIGEDFITLKVKKGLLYSKAEKFGISEIDFIEDTNGKKIKLTNTTSQNKLNEFSEEKETPKLYFRTGDLIKEENKPTHKPEQIEVPNNRLYGLNRLNKSNEIEKRTQPELNRSFPNVQDQYKDKYSRMTESEKRKPERQRAETVVTAKDIWDEQENSTQNNLVTSDENLVEEPAGDSEALDTEVQPLPIDNYSETNTSVAEVHKLKILRYQTIILFSVGLFIVSLIIFLKATGLKGSAFGKFSLFPSHIMKISGKYGIIDQGSEDGVKVDDLIRLYRKYGTKIEFKGKVKVIKVADNYSAVEMLKINRHAPLEVGDVGFRDRNFILTSLKRARILISAIFSGLGKTFNFAAQNLEVKQKEPEINYGIFHKEVKPKNGSPITKLQKATPPQKVQLVTPHKPAVPEVKAKKKPAKPAVNVVNTKKKSNKPDVTVVNSKKELSKPSVTTVKTKTENPKPKVVETKQFEETQLIGFGLEDD